MQYSTLTEINTTRQPLELFAGYNHNLRINEGEFYDMKNMASDYFPVLSPRKQRGTYNKHTVTKANGLVSKDTLCVADGTKFYVNGSEITGLDLTDTPKELVSMGAYVIIMPDKKYVNTADLSDHGSIEASFITTGNVEYSMCDMEGKIYEDVIKSSGEPTGDIESGTYWLDLSQTPHQLKVFSGSSSVWMPVPTVYCRITAPHIASNFKDFDGVKILGIDSSHNPQLKDYDGKISILYKAFHDEGDSTITPARAEGTNDYLVIVGLVDENYVQTSPLTISRDMPNLDFIIESENRLWGCRYGVNVDGEVVNEIYASKLGDFKNWNCFLGISTDSYIASCGTDGAWTGAIAHLGYPVFFKENYVHKVYGNYPSNYQIQATACRGVMKGAGKSLAIVNEVLYYKSRNGVCAYDGSLPVEITSGFGEIHYSALDESNSDFLRNGAVAGSHHNKYYISMKSEVDGLWHLFVYDANNKIWHKEDNTRADQFCSCQNEMYFIDHADGKVKTVLGSGDPIEEPIDWYVETGTLGIELVDRKYISRLLIRMQLEIGSRVSFSIQYDSSGEWVPVSNVTGTSLRSFAFPLRPKRCDHFRLRINGHGPCKIFSITKTIEQGSDI